MRAAVGELSEGNGDLGWIGHVFGMLAPELIEPLAEQDCVLRGKKVGLCVPA